MSKAARIVLALGIGIVGITVFLNIAEPTAATAERRLAQPELIPYSVINRDTMGKIKLSYNLRIDLVDGRLPTADEIEVISRHLLEKEGRHYDKMFVVYYLPGMEVNAGGFATGHYYPDFQTPALQVKIQDYLLPEQYKHLL